MGTFLSPFNCYLGFLFIVRMSKLFFQETQQARAGARAGHISQCFAGKSLWVHPAPSEVCGHGITSGAVLTPLPWRKVEEQPVVEGHRGHEGMRSAGFLSCGFKKPRLPPTHPPTSRHLKQIL